MIDRERPAVESLGTEELVAEALQAINDARHSVLLASMALKDAAELGHPFPTTLEQQRISRVSKAAGDIANSLRGQIEKIEIIEKSESEALETPRAWAYTRITDEIPDEASVQNPQASIEIIGDTEIVVGGTRIELTINQLYFLNLFLKNPGTSYKLKDIVSGYLHHKLSGDGKPEDACRMHLFKFMKKLSDAAGVEVIEGLGKTRARTYSLGKQLAFSDLRESSTDFLSYEVGWPHNRELIAETYQELTSPAETSQPKSKPVITLGQPAPEHSGGNGNGHIEPETAQRLARLIRASQSARVKEPLLVAPSPNGNGGPPVESPSPDKNTKNGPKSKRVLVPIIPDRWLPEKDDTPDIILLSDTEIKVGDQTLRLSESQIYLLNILLNEELGISIKDFMTIAEPDYESEKTRMNAFQNGIKQLRRIFKDLFGEDNDILLSTQDQGAKKYRLNPGITLLDMRKRDTKISVVTETVEPPPGEATDDQILQSIPGKSLDQKAATMIITARRIVSSKTPKHRDEIDTLERTMVAIIRASNSAAMEQVSPQLTEQLEAARESLISKITSNYQNLIRTRVRQAYGRNLPEEILETYYSEISERLVERLGSLPLSEAPYFSLIRDCVDNIDDLRVLTV